MTIARVGTEFVVNTTTQNDQDRSTVTATNDGRFIVTWTDGSQTGTDTSFTAVRARIFNANGLPSVSEFVVNSVAANFQTESAVTLLADGKFLVTWTDSSQTDDDQFAFAIRGRIFNADGTEAVAQFRINSTAAGSQDRSSVTTLNDGRFIVTWSDSSGTGGDIDGSAVRARIFNADGSESVAEFLVNTTTSANQRESSVTVLTNGNIVMTWTDTSQTGGDTSFDAVRARIFNSSGVEVASEFLVNTATSFLQNESEVKALPDGRFIVIWRGEDVQGEGVQARIFNADGSESVPEFTVNTTTDGNQFQSTMTVLADGRLLITWTDTSATGNDTDGNAIRGRILNVDGSGAIPEFIINSTVAADQSRSAVTAMADGSFVVTWRDQSATGDDTSGMAIRSQIFNPLVFNGTAVADTVTGGSLSDRYFGNGGADNISGRGGADSLYGGAEGDTLDGGDGGDNLWGGTGADLLIGGTDAGIDYARYDDANHGNLTIRLDGGANVGAAALGDTYSSIEGLVGGAGNDTVFGNASANYLFGSGGNDNMYGQAGADYINGGEGTNQLWGGAGADNHIGGSGLDYARYDDANWGNLIIRLDAPAVNLGAVAVGDTYTGIEGLVGGLGSDAVIGNASNNYLFGGGGADYIDARVGNDYMNGGVGADRFVFATALNAATNVDVVADFTHGTDDFNLAKSIFTAMGATLDASELRLGTAAADANDYIIYNSANGQLFYDANGSGAGGQTLFATVTAGTVLDVGDFVMV